MKFPRINVPSLSKGDLLFFVTGGSNRQVLKITDSSKFVKINIPITVKNGKIIQQGEIIQE